MTPIVFVSALIAREGPPGRLLSAVKHGDCTLVTSVYQVEELKKVLGRDRLKPYIRPTEADDFAFPTPPIIRVGMSGGIKAQLQDRPRIWRLRSRAPTEKASSAPARPSER